LLRRSAHQPTGRRIRRAVALSHACWLLTYPLAGWLDHPPESLPTLLVLAALTFAGVLGACPGNGLGINEASSEVFLGDKFLLSVLLRVLRGCGRCQIMAHSALTLSMLRRRTGGTLACLIWPKTGSTICFAIDTGFGSLRA